jgi:hypothetical protein
MRRLRQILQSYPGYRAAGYWPGRAAKCAILLHVMPPIVRWRMRRDGTLDASGYPGGPDGRRA